MLLGLLELVWGTALVSGRARGPFLTTAEVPTVHTPKSVDWSERPTHRQAGSPPPLPPCGHLQQPLIHPSLPNLYKLSALSWPIKTKLERWTWTLHFKVSALNYRLIATKVTSFVVYTFSVPYICFQEYSSNVNGDTAKKVLYSSSTVPLLFWLIETRCLR